MVSGENLESKRLTRKIFRNKELARCARLSATGFGPPIRSAASPTLAPKNVAKPGTLSLECAHAAIRPLCVRPLEMTTGGSVEYANECRPLTWGECFRNAGKVSVTGASDDCDGSTEVVPKMGRMSGCGFGPQRCHEVNKNLALSFEKTEEQGRGTRRMDGSSSTGT